MQLLNLARQGGVGVCESITCNSYSYSKHVSNENYELMVIAKPANTKVWDSKTMIYFSSGNAGVVALVSSI